MTPKQATFEAMMDALKPFAEEHRKWLADKAGEYNLGDEIYVPDYARAAEAYTLAKDSRDE